MALDNISRAIAVITPALEAYDRDPSSPENDASYDLMTELIQSDENVASLAQGLAFIAAAFVNEVADLKGEEPRESFARAALALEAMRCES